MLAQVIVIEDTVTWAHIRPPIGKHCASQSFHILGFEP